MVDRLPALAISLLFLAVGIATLDDYGVTWDEPVTIAAAGFPWVEAHFERLGLDPIAQEFPGYYFVSDQLRGWFADLVVRQLGWTDLVSAYHFVQLLWAALAVYLLGRIVLLIGGNQTLSVLAMLALVGLPKFIGHSQNNPKDLPALLCFVMTSYAALRMLSDRRPVWVLVTGVCFGLALNTRTLSVLIPVIVSIWLVWAQPGALAEIRGRAAAALAVAAVTFLLCWPWLWADPIDRLAEAAHKLARFMQHSPRVLYLGEIRPARELPWHYLPVSLIVSIPSVWLLALLGNFARVPAARSTPTQGELEKLALVWVGVIGLVGVASPTHYDGVRHFLMILPGLAIGIATGAWRVGLALQGALGRPTAARWCAIGIGGAAGLWLAFGAVRIHPYHDAYLNELANAWISGPSEDVFEVEYWGHPQKQGARWLNAHAEPEAEIHLPWIENANLYLDRPGRLLDARRFVETPEPAYLMLFTKKARYDEFLRFVTSECEPVFAIRRQRATLLEIYRNADVRRALERTRTRLGSREQRMSSPRTIPPPRSGAEAVVAWKLGVKPRSNP